MKVAVIGCGHGGQVLSADIATKGCDVSLYADEKFPGSIKTIMQTKSIECIGALNCFSKIKCATTDMNKAVKDAQIIFLVLPSNAHLPMFNKMLPYLKSGQTVVVLAANFAPLFLYRALKEQAPDKDITIAGISSLPYACRIIEPGKVRITGIKKCMRIATIPTYHRTDEVKNLLESFFPTKLLKYSNILELGLNITSGISHTLNTIFNAGRIGLKEEDFYFYKDGITVDTALVIEHLDKERRNIGSLYGLTLPSYLDLMKEFYGNSFSSLYDFFQNTPIHNAMKFCPKSVHERYLSQDIPHVLVPWYNLGNIGGHDSELIRSIIILASKLNNKEYLQNSLFSSEDVLGNLKPENIIYYVNSGSLKTK